MLAGWSAIAAAILTVTGVISLLVIFGTGSAALGALNDLNTIAMAVVTLPVAMALHPVASRSWGLAGDGRRGRGPRRDGPGRWFQRPAGDAGHDLRGDADTGWLGIAGGAGLAVSAMAFPLLGREHPIIAVAGSVALVGLVGFYAWAGVLLLRGRIHAG